MNSTWLLDPFYLIDRKHNDIEFKLSPVREIYEILHVLGREGKAWMQNIWVKIYSGEFNYFIIKSFGM